MLRIERLMSLPKVDIREMHTFEDRSEADAVTTPGVVKLNEKRVLLVGDELRKVCLRAHYHSRVVHRVEGLERERLG